MTFVQVSCCFYLILVTVTVRLLFSLSSVCVQTWKNIVLVTGAAKLPVSTLLCVYLSATLYACARHLNERPFHWF